MKEKTGRMPKLVNDYRTLLDDKSVDVFMVATPDPLARTAHDRRLHGRQGRLRREARQPQHSSKARQRWPPPASMAEWCRWARRSAAHPSCARRSDYVSSGALGKVIHGKAWETDRSGAVHLAADSAPPTGFDYEIWQGPAPERQYNASIVGGAWRWLYDYGTGDLGNDGVHRIDYCRHVMGLEGMPEAICCSGGKFFFEDDQQWPDTMLINYEYPGKVLQVRDAPVVKAETIRRHRGGGSLR